MAVKEDKKPSRINNLRFTYPGIDGHPPPGSTPLIDDFSLTLYPGDRCLLAGSDCADYNFEDIGRAAYGRTKHGQSAGKGSTFHDIALTASGDLGYLGGEERIQNDEMN